MKMNRIVLIVALLMSTSAILADGPSGCGTNLTTLTVGTDTDGDIGYVPFELKTGETLTGFDIEVAVEVAHRLGFETTTFRQIPFSQSGVPGPTNPYPLLHELNKQTSQLDLALAALSIIRRPEPLKSPVPAFTNTGFVNYNDDKMGVLISAKADEKYSDPATFLEQINNDNPDTPAVAVVILNSRENIIIDPQFFFLGATDQYPNISEFLEITLQRAVDAFKVRIADPLRDVNQNFLFLDNATAQALYNDKSIFPEGTVRLLTDVIDTKNVSPSQGLGIAVGGIETGSQGCEQLYANVAQAIKDMAADGTLAQLRAKYNVSSTDTDLGATFSATTGAQTINSNVIHNFYFTKYGKGTVIVGAPVQ